VNRNPNVFSRPADDTYLGHSSGKPPGRRGSDIQVLEMNQMISARGAKRSGFRGKRILSNQLHALRGGVAREGGDSAGRRGLGGCVV
jgi:hypothetical protein